MHQGSTVLVYIYIAHSIIVYIDIWAYRVVITYSIYNTLDIHFAVRQFTLEVHNTHIARSNVTIVTKLQSGSNILF